MTTHLLRLARLVSLVLLAMFFTSLLAFTAPGYFTQSGELDAAHAATARAQTQHLRLQGASAGALLQHECLGWIHGDLGRSRQFDVPVVELLKPRVMASAALLVQGLSWGWLAAGVASFAVCWRKGVFSGLVATGLSALLLALPVGALATLCLVSNHGGAVLVLGTVIAVRDFRLLYRLLRQALEAPHIEHARAQGFGAGAMLTVHLRAHLAGALPQLALNSVLVALSALVPVEVIFDSPGLGQLAWAAAMNRDLPVLVAVTGLMACCVAILAAWQTTVTPAEEVLCAL